jgi:hypothetical protein
LSQGSEILHEVLNHTQERKKLAGENIGKIFGPNPPEICGNNFPVVSLGGAKYLKTFKKLQVCKQYIIISWNKPNKLYNLG